jgi:hypothetical protein
VCPRNVPQTSRTLACKEVDCAECGENSDAKHRTSQGRRRNIPSRGCGPQLWPRAHILNACAREPSPRVRRFHLRRRRHFRNVLGASLGAAWMPISAWPCGNIAEQDKVKCCRIGVEAGAAGMILWIGPPSGSSGTGTASRKRQGRTPACQHRQKQPGRECFPDLHYPAVLHANGSQAVTEITSASELVLSLKGILQRSPQVAEAEWISARYQLRRFHSLASEQNGFSHLAK